MMETRTNNHRQTMQVAPSRTFFDMMADLAKEPEVVFGRRSDRSIVRLCTLLWVANQVVLQMYHNCTVN